MGKRAKARGLLPRRRLIAFGREPEKRELGQNDDLPSRPWAGFPVPPRSPVAIGSAKLCFARLVAAICILPTIGKRVQGLASSLVGQSTALSYLPSSTWFLLPLYVELDLPELPCRIGPPNSHVKGRFMLALSLPPPAFVRSIAERGAGAATICLAHFPSRDASGPCIKNCCCLQAPAVQPVTARRSRRDRFGTRFANGRRDPRGPCDHSCARADGSSIQSTQLGYMEGNQPCSLPAASPDRTDAPFPPLPRSGNLPPESAAHGARKSACCGNMLPTCVRFRWPASRPDQRRNSGRPRLGSHRGDPRPPLASFTSPATRTRSPCRCVRRHTDWRTPDGSTPPSGQTPRAWARGCEPGWSPGSPPW